MRTSFRLALGATVLVAGTALVLALTVAPSTEEKEQVDRADRVAQEYERRLARDVDDLAVYVAKRRFENETDYQKLYDEVMQRIEDVPSIPAKGTTKYARENSRDYRNAKARRALELEPYRDFALRLESDVIPRQEFVDLGIDIVKINPVKLLEGFAVQFSGQPLRSEVVPEYRKVRRKLKKQKPGPQDAELARDLQRYVDDAIKQTQDGADDIDAGRAFFFDFGDRPKTLLARLEATQRSIAAEVSAQVDAFDSVGPS